VNRSNKPKLKAVMIYLDPFEAARLSEYADKECTSASKIAREGIQMRMRDKFDQYVTGFNDGLNEALRVAATSKGGQMMFPSGKSFSQLVCEDIEKLKKRNKVDS